jgi:hypothetical protein
VPAVAVGPRRRAGGHAGGVEVFHDDGVEALRQGGGQLVPAVRAGPAGPRVQPGDPPLGPLPAPGRRPPGAGGIARASPPRPPVRRPASRRGSQRSPRSARANASKPEL